MLGERSRVSRSGLQPSRRLPSTAWRAGCATGSDGSVEALLQGDEEEVRRVLDWARLGPPLANVTEVEEEFLDLYPRQKGFRITD